MRASALALRLLASLVIGAAFLYAVSKQIDVVPEDLTPKHNWALPAFIATLAAYFLLRAGRWWILLRPLGEVSFRDATAAALAGIMWTGLLPFRLGELARPLLIAQCTQISVARSLSSVALERVADGLVVCALFFAMFGSGGRAQINPEFAAVYDVSTVVVSGFGVALMGLLLAGRFPATVRSLIRGTVGRVSPAVGDKLADFAGGIAEGLATLPSPAGIVAFLLVTAAYWGVNVLGAWLLANGLGIGLTLLETGAVVAVINLALLIPAGPAQAGNFQAGVFLGLSLFVSRELVAGPGAQYLFWMYVLQMAGAVLAGIIGHAILKISWRRVFAVRS